MISISIPYLSEGPKMLDTTCQVCPFQPLEHPCNIELCHVVVLPYYVLIVANISFSQIVIEFSKIRLHKI